MATTLRIVESTSPARTEPEDDIILLWDGFTVESMHDLDWQEKSEEKKQQVESASAARRATRE
jgi:hypothetical protein